MVVVAMVSLSFLNACDKNDNSKDIVYGYATLLSYDIPDDATTEDSEKLSDYLASKGYDTNAWLINASDLKEADKIALERFKTLTDKMTVAEIKALQLPEKMGYSLTLVNISHSTDYTYLAKWNYLNGEISYKTE